MDLEQAIAKLKQTNIKSYYKSDLPNDIDELLSVVVNQYPRMTSAERECVIESFCIEETEIFITYARRMAVLAVRMHDPELISRGLIALAIEDARIDWRDTLIVLTLLHHSARKLKAEPKARFINAAEIASSKTAKLILSVARFPSSLKAMGHKEMLTPSGFDYEWLTYKHSERLRGSIIGILLNSIFVAVVWMLKLIRRRK